MINKKRKPTPIKITAKVTEETPPEVTQIEPAQEEKVTQPIEEVTPKPVPAPETKVEPPTKPKPLTMADLKAEVDELRTLVQTLITQMTDVQSQLLLKRKPTANNKVKIKDKLMGKVFKSKNNTYQSLLKSGDLKELVERGLFGDSPERNNFGVYALFRAWPDRFEEVHETEQEPTTS